MLLQTGSQPIMHEDTLNLYLIRVQSKPHSGESYFKWQTAMAGTVVEFGIYRQH
jgi:hypothetical protein